MNFQWANKDLYLADLINNSNINYGEFYSLTKWLDGRGIFLRNDMRRVVGLLEYAKEYKYFIEFLFDNGYVESVKSEYDKWVDKCPFPDRTNPNTHCSNFPSIKNEFIKWAECMPRYR